MKNTISLLFLCLLCTFPAFAGTFRMDLSGIWRFQLDPLGFGTTPGSELYLEKLAETIVLPGSTDEGGKGVKNNARYVDRLSRKFEYQGAAWYQREVVVPENWAGKRIVLHLERCHWATTVYVDGKEAGNGERLSTPNRFDLTKWLTPGVHSLTICVDNVHGMALAHGFQTFEQLNIRCGIIGVLIYCFFHFIVLAIAP